MQEEESHNHEHKDFVLNDVFNFAWHCLLPRLHEEPQLPLNTYHEPQRMHYSDHGN